MNKFLCVLDLEVKFHLDCIRQLARMNYGNYLTADVYDHIKEKILSIEDEKQQLEILQDFIDILTSKFVNQGTELWKYNNAVVKELLKLKKISPDTQDEFDYIVVKANIHNYIKEYPNEYEAKLEEIAKRLKCRVINNNEEIIIETYLEDKN